MKLFPGVLLRSILVGAGLCALLLTGCRSAPPPAGAGRRIVMETTGYCPCGKCCGWKRNWYGRAVYAYGPNKGRPKQVGVCADGTKARYGVIAADTRYYPFGTRMYVPGYGYGVVHDRGAAIRGPRRLDLFFPRHSQAVQWGRRRVTVVVLPSN